MIKKHEKVILPLLPLRGMIVFPHMVTPLDVGRDRSIRALEEAMVQDRRIVLAAQKQARIQEPGSDDIYPLGTVAEIKQLLKLPEGHVRILVEGITRIEIEAVVQEDPFYQVEGVEIEVSEPEGSEAEAMVRTSMDLFERYVKLSKKVPAEVLQTLAGIEEPGRLADTLAAHLPLKVEERQEILSIIPIDLRLEKLVSLLTKELEIQELERSIHNRVRRQMEKTQKEYYLREQMKAIQKELGDRDERADEIDQLREEIEKAKMPKAVREKAERELERLERMPPVAAEAVVVRNYLDWLIALPWEKSTKDRLDLARAQEILDEDHFGLDKVKERIVEFLAVRQLAKKMKGPILCLVGPPGVGKTSLARSVARSLGRKFVRFSLGGIRDEAEIRGHRRTYVGAMPGKVIQAMRDAGSKNPVLLLDEIDKMTMDFRGDPSAALLEVLDPEQNNSFKDHFIEVDVDLSHVMFITTANTLHEIPRPLLDRMEVIEIPGYTEEEKLEIAGRHLLPKQTKDHGLKEEQILLSEATIRQIIRLYTRESGVRSMERNLASICRKVCREVVAGAEKVRVTPGNVQKYLGPPRYRFGAAELEDQVGVATGLVWTQVGGDLISIEVTTTAGKGKLTLTGKLGEVMRESAQASYTYIRSRAESLGLDPLFYEKVDVHIHVPEGAIPKEGPSAGITMATALASALSGKPIRRDVAMTGEITLRGRVLPIGGLKEKALAAHRAGIKDIVIPLENEKDLEEIPASIRKKVNFHLVGHMDEVLGIALRGQESSPVMDPLPPEASQEVPEDQSWMV